MIRETPGCRAAAGCNSADWALWPVVAAPAAGGGDAAQPARAAAIVCAVPAARRAEPTRHLGHEAGGARGGARRISPGCHQRARHADHRTAAAPGPASAPLQHRAFHDPFGHQPQCGDVSGDDRQRAAARANRLHADRERLPAPRRPGGVRSARSACQGEGRRRRRRFRCRTRSATAPTPVPAKTAASSAPLRAVQHLRRSQRRRFCRPWLARDRRQPARGRPAGTVADGGWRPGPACRPPDRRVEDLGRYQQQAFAC